MLDVYSKRAEACKPSKSAVVLNIHAVCANSDINGVMGKLH